MLFVALYLAAVVAANVTIATFGPRASIITAFLLIGATLTLRDRIHDVMGAKAMFVLIPLGALLSLPFSTGRIALASAGAFFLAETVDTLVYHFLRKRDWYLRANGSNVVSSAVDSLAFPTIAFGAIMWPIIIGQFIAKVAGGAIWSYVLNQRRARVSVATALALACIGLPSLSEAQSTPKPAPKPPKIVVQAQAGTIHYPFKDYKPVGNVGINSIIFLPKKFSVLLVASRDMVRGEKMVYVAALQYVLWRK